MADPNLLNIAIDFGTAIYRFAKLAILSHWHRWRCTHWCQVPATSFTVGLLDRCALQVTPQLAELYVSLRLLGQFPWNSVTGDCFHSTAEFRRLYWNSMACHEILWATENRRAE